METKVKEHGNNKEAMSAEEWRVSFYGKGDSRAYDPDELYLMKEYAKDFFAIHNSLLTLIFETFKNKNKSNE